MEGGGNVNPGYTARSSISVIVPVLHEGLSIRERVHDLMTLDGGTGIEIIVVDGDPGGGTIRTIDSPGVMTAVAERGRASQMNHGARLASNDLLLFLHADTRLPHNAFSLIREAMSDSRVVAGSFELGIASSRWVFRITERYAALRTRITRTPFGDQAIFVDRKCFARLGGYRMIPIMEDVELMSRIRKQGDRIRIIPHKVLTSDRRWKQEGVLYCTLRNWMLQAAYAFGVSPDRLARWYRN